ncbi:hypothetical protein BGX30_007345, partial [Mortierella sp. GBA39]
MMLFDGIEISGDVAMFCNEDASLGCIDDDEDDTDKEEEDQNRSNMDVDENDAGACVGLDLGTKADDVTDKPSAGIFHPDMPSGDDE